MKLGIIGAMEIEIALIRERMDVESTHTEAGMEFFSGKLDGRDVVLSKCGVGKVCAAACAQLMVSRFGVTHLVNTGIAGAISPELEIGNIVVADDCRYYDVNVHHYAYEVGQVPGMPAFFEVDTDMLESLFAATMLVDYYACVGTVITGDTFICDIAERRELMERYIDPMCCDMEGAAIGQVAYMNGIPYAVLRVISDKGDGKTSDEADIEAARIAATITANLPGMLY